MYYLAKFHDQVMYNSKYIFNSIYTLYAYTYHDIATLTITGMV